MSGGHRNVVRNGGSASLSHYVIPPNAGTHGEDDLSVVNLTSAAAPWVPAFAGMTDLCREEDLHFVVPAQPRVVNHE